MDASSNRQRVEKVVNTRVRDLIAEGLRWRVCELAAPPFDRRGGTHLVFDGEVIMRRVRFFPPNWYELSDEDLYALSEHIHADE